MSVRARSFLALIALVFSALGAASNALALANRVFVSARSGNDANSCDNVNTPCQTLQGAIGQLILNGEAIVLDSGAYGAVTITQGVTIEAPAGVTAFIHPSSGNAITVNAPQARVTLRGLVLNTGFFDGIIVNAVFTLNVENCFITGFEGHGIRMASAGRLYVIGTVIKNCGLGIAVVNTSGLVRASIDHCHLDGNIVGYHAATTSPGSSTTTASNSTANHNDGVGWVLGNGTSGRDLLSLEFCTGSENGVEGVRAGSMNFQSVTRYSNCIFANNGTFGVGQFNSSHIQSRGNNTITGNGTAPTNGNIGVFSPM